MRRECLMRNQKARSPCKSFKEVRHTNNGMCHLFEVAITSYKATQISQHFLIMGQTGKVDETCSAVDDDSSSKARGVVLLNLVNFIVSQPTERDKKIGKNIRKNLRTLRSSQLLHPA